MFVAEKKSSHLSNFFFSERTTNNANCEFSGDGFVVTWWYEQERSHVVFDIKQNNVSGKRYTAIGFGNSMKVPHSQNRVKIKKAKGILSFRLFFPICAYRANSSLSQKSNK